MSEAPSVTVVLDAMRDVEVAKRLLRRRVARLERAVSAVVEWVPFVPPPYPTTEVDHKPT